MNELPQNNEQLHAYFAERIKSVVRKQVKFALNRDEVESEVWTRLLQADVLGRFYASTTADKPATMGRLRAYVNRAARNHLANIFRTHRRRFALEHVHNNPQVNIDGEQWDTWEESLRACTITPEAFCIFMNEQRQRWTIRASMAD